MKYNLVSNSVCKDEYSELLARIDSNSDYWRNATSPVEKKLRGQHFTPLSMAVQLSVMSSPNVSAKSVIGDPGAGTGILSAALASRLQNQNLSKHFSIYGFETDQRLHDDLSRAWSFFSSQAESNSDYEIQSDFTVHAKSLLERGEIDGLSKPDFITTNPPYNKLSSKEPLSLLLKKHGISSPNLYSAFMVLAAKWVADDGHLLAVLPRSFCSGAYFKDFRKFLMENLSIEHITLYKSRSCFKNVLQENILFYARKRKQVGRIRITVAKDPDSKPEYDLVLPSADILNESHWSLPRTVKDIHLYLKNQKRNRTFPDAGYRLSTGKLELHRQSGHLTTKVVYSSDFDNAGNWTWGEKKKPRFLETNSKNRLSLPTSGGYVVLKRISSNDGDEPKRLMPAWLSRTTIGDDVVALENHVQYIHKMGEPLSEDEGKSLVEFLSSDEAQAVMRTINGTTQINKTDMDRLNIPWG